MQNYLPDWPLQICYAPDAIIPVVVDKLGRVRGKLPGLLREEYRPDPSKYSVRLVPRDEWSAGLGWFGESPELDMGYPDMNAED